ncbi:hypothetical protein J6590_003774 [Homalodisca vitripennis]|nr:hypothetical protein J6590_003774 [Homalodisca vitripennis]
MGGFNNRFYRGDSPKAALQIGVWLQRPRMCCTIYCTVKHKAISRIHIKPRVESIGECARPVSRSHASTDTVKRIMFLVPRRRGRLRVPALPLSVDNAST